MTGQLFKKKKHTCGPAGMRNELEATAVLCEVLQPIGADLGVSARPPASRPLARTDGVSLRTLPSDYLDLLPALLATTALIYDDPFFALVRQEVLGMAAPIPPSSMSRPSTSHHQHSNAKRPSASFEEARYEDPK